MASHLQLIDALDDRRAAIHEAFIAVWGDDADALEVQHLNGLIALGASAERAKTEFTMRRFRRLRDA